MSSSQVKFGIVGGAGRRGLVHLKVLKTFKDAHVKAICDIDEARLRKVAEAYKVNAYTDLDEMLNKENLDAVVISTPTPVHISQTLKCLERGLDVLLEKPISLSLAEAKKLYDAVKRSNCFVVVGFQSRYSNIVREIENILDRDTLSMLHGFWYWTIPIVGWIRRRSMGGGQIVDQAIHLIDLYRLFAGEVEKVYAVYTERGRDTEEDRATGFDNWASYVVAFKFKNGVVGGLCTTYALYPNIFPIPEGVKLEDRATAESAVMIDIICREMLIRYVHGKEVRVYQRGKETRVIRLEGDSTVNMLRAFVEAVQTRDKTLIRTPYEDSFRTMAVALAANFSAERGAVVDLDAFISSEG